MYFIILVIIHYIRLWLSKNSKAVLNSLMYNKDVRGFIVFGYASAAVIGLYVGYSLWFIYYCVINYLYPLF